MTAPAAPTPVRVALDVMGGDDAPASVVAGAVRALQHDAHLQVQLVGRSDDVAAALDRALADVPDGERLRGRASVVTASEVVGMDEDPARAVRRKRDASVRVAARRVRDGDADAVVSCGSTGAALAAAVFTLGRLPGVARPALAVALPGLRGRTVYLDVGATVQAEVDLLPTYALLGVAFAAAGLGVPEPRVGLLSTGEEPGKGDDVRRAAHGALDDALRDLPARFVGNVEGRDLPWGAAADVVVTDGFTGNVLLKGLEGCFDVLRTAVREAAAERGADGEAAAALVADALAPLDPEGEGGAVLLGVPGVVVVGHGSSGPEAVAACLALAARTSRDGLVDRAGALVADLVARRRARDAKKPAGADENGDPAPAARPAVATGAP